MLLTVLSTLARLNVDPWQEAANLTGMSKDMATRRLASMIATLPDEPAARREPGKIAARLIALLPNKASPAAAVASGAAPGDVTARKSGVVAFLIFMGFAMVFQFVMASHQPPAPTDTARAPASGTVAPKEPPPIPSQ